MNMDEVFRVIDEAFNKERAEQERLIIKKLESNNETRLH